MGKNKKKSTVVYSDLFLEKEDKNILEKVAAETKAKVLLVSGEYELVDIVEIKGKIIDPITNIDTGYTQVDCKLFDGRQQTFYFESEIIEEGGNNNVV